MADKAWKAMERKVAKAFGGHRIPGSGVQRFGPMQGDALVPDPRILLECKWRQSFLHHSLFNDNAAKAKKMGKSLPLLVTKVAGETGELVTLRMSDFLELVDIDLGEAG